VRYFEFLESNTHIIYPLLAVLVVVLIAVGVASALRAEELDGHQKSEIKRDIIAELRREVHGITVEQLAKAIGLTSHKAYKVLEEMASDNIVESRTDTRRHTTWRMKNF
jgi:predicted HTH transcriptional regulator